MIRKRSGQPLARQSKLSRLREETNENADFAAMLSMAGASAHAATFVYVSNAEDGNIGMYTLQADGSLQPGARVDAAKVVMPMAVSPDKRFLVAAVRSKPYEAYTYAIEDLRCAEARRQGPARGELSLHRDRPHRPFSAQRVLWRPPGGREPDQRGRQGRRPIQVIPTARNAHAIRVDNTNSFVFVPHLGTDQMFQFVLDKKSGKLSANTPPVVQLKQGTGPRHLIFSHDNKFVYLLNELTATVTTLALDAKDGTLKEVDSASALPPDTKLGAGAPRGAVGVPGQAPRNTDNDIWASDLHLTPNGRFLYAAERTSSTLGAFRVDAASGKLTYVGSTPTEKQPRGFAIDRAAGSSWCRARSRTRSRPTRSTPRPGR